MNTAFEKQMINLLPQGFTARGAQESDVAPALKLFNRWSQSVVQQDEVTDAGRILNEWRSPGFNPAEDIRLVFAPDGRMAGYIEAWTNFKPLIHPWLWGRVDPEFEGLGIGSHLLEWAENRAVREMAALPEDVRFAPRVGIYQAAVRSRQLYEDMGYQRIRSSYTMRIDMPEPPAEPVWPAGIRVRTFDVDRDLEAAYRADVESFQDHFGYVEEPYEEGLAHFKHFQTGYEGFDPTLFFLAVEGEEVIGLSVCTLSSYDDPDLGWVSSLGIRRPWRKRGVGLAILQHSFAELYRRGRRKAGLGVDAQNLTGALRLYERAGMHVHLASDLFEKEIRPGREISVQSLSS